MAQITTEFFRTWGFGVHDGNSKDQANQEPLLHLLGFIDYIPFMGTATGLTKMYLLATGELGAGKNWSTATKAGVVARSVIAAVGLGVLCLPVDTGLSIARHVRAMTEPFSWKMTAQAVNDFFESWGFRVFGPALEHTDSIVSPLRESRGQATIRNQFTLISIVSYIPVLGSIMSLLALQLSTDSTSSATRELSVAARVGLAARSVLVSTASTATLFSPIGWGVLGACLVTDVAISVIHAVNKFSEDQRQQQAVPSTPADQVD